MAYTRSISRRGITIVPDGSTDFNIATMQATTFALKTITGVFTVGETVTGGASSATGVVVAFEIASGNLWLTYCTGTFQAAETVTGGSSSAHGVIVIIPNVPFANGIRLSAVRLKGSAGDLLVVREQSATGSVVFAFTDKDGKGEKQSIGGRSLRVSPYIAHADCSFASPASAEIFLEFD